MAYPQFYDQFIRPEPSGEVLSDEVVVERAGYIPAKEQIEGMIMAGLRLGEFRREAFDYGSEEEDDGALDPMRQNPDLAEVSEMVREVNERLIAQASAKSVVEEVQAEKPDVPAPAGD